MLMEHHLISYEDLKSLAKLDDVSFAKLIIFENPDQETIDRICDALDMTEEEILNFPLKMRRVKGLDENKCNNGYKGDTVATVATGAKREGRPQSANASLGRAHLPRRTSTKVYNLGRIKLRVKRPKKKLMPF